jgi:hypothetical protein
VRVTGSGFVSSDTSCTMSGFAGLIIGQACVVSPGTGTLTGTFVVGAVAAGQSYTITVSGNNGDYGQAVFTVTSGPTILTLYPSGSVTPGTLITFTAVGPLTVDTGCTLQSLPSTVILYSPSCTIDFATHVATGAFVDDSSGRFTWK